MFGYGNNSKTRRSDSTGFVPYRPYRMKIRIYPEKLNAIGWKTSEILTGFEKNKGRIIIRKAITISTRSFVGNERPK